MTATAAPIPARAVVFDAYGTLFDFGSATSRLRDELGEAREPLTALWRDKQLQYTWLRAAQGRHADFHQVTGDALDVCLATLGLERPGLRDRLMALYHELAPFPEAGETLRRLRDDGLPLAILSNGTPDMLAAAVDAAEFGAMFAAVISAEEVGVYKPAPAVYQRAVERLGVAAGDIAFVSGNAWDIHAASAFGFRTLWCNRSGGPDDRLPGTPDRTMRSLRELPDLVVAAV
jgi:2-haloacid dehalogenase